MNLEDLSPEMQEKIRACESPEEILELAQKVGHTLSDVELEVIAEAKRSGTGCNARDAEAGTSRSAPR
jgi:hypothetical protein